MTTYNKLYPAWIKGDNNITQGSGYSDNISFRNDGKTEMRGDVYVNNSGRLMINKDKNSSTQYYLDVSGNSNFNGDVIINNKNNLSKVQTIGASTTLTFGSAEYVCILSTCPANSIITLPTINSASQIGTKFTFFYCQDGYPTVSIYGAQGQTIIDNIQTLEVAFMNITYNKTLFELVCVSYNVSGVCWALSNGIYDYYEFARTIEDNSWAGLNTFPTPATSDNSQTVATTQYVKSNLLAYQPTSSMTGYALLAGPAFTGNPTSTTQLTTDNSTRLATTAYVKSNLSSYQTTANMSSYALLAGPAFTGNPTATTQLTTNNSTRIATTAYVKSNLNDYSTTIYADGLITSLLSSVNDWTNYNSFDVYLPTSSLTPANGPELVTKYYTDDNFLSKIDASNAYLSIIDASNTYLKTVSMASYALLASPAFTGTPTAPTQITANNSTRIATTQYVKANLASYQTTIAMSFYLLTADASNNYLKIIDASNNYQPISNMGNYVLQSYLNANYYTTGEIINNYANLNTTNTLTGSLALYGVCAFRNNTSLLDSKVFSITAGSTFDCNGGSTVNLNSITTFGGTQIFTTSTTFASLPSASTVITSAGTDNFITKRIANLLYAGVSNTTLLNPTMKNTPTFIPSGEIICSFQNDSGEAINIRNSGYGLSANNALCIDTTQTNGLALNSNTSGSGINFYIAKTLIGQVLSTGLSISNISFTGTLNTMTTAIFSSIATAFGKQTSSSNSVITAAITLAAPFNQVYSIFNGATAFTITLPTPSISNVGVVIFFRRATGSTTTTIISINQTGGASLYGATNAAAATQVLLASGAYINRITCIYNNTLYGWYIT